MEQILTENAPSVSPDHGYYAAVTVTTEPQEVQRICQDPSSVEKILTDLPMGVSKLFDFVLEDASQERVVLRNDRPSGTLTLNFEADPARGGTIISADARIKGIHWNEEGPSTLMNIFLKRLKCLVETGEIPTTKGQPSGREILRPNHH